MVRGVHSERYWHVVSWVSDIAALASPSQSQNDLTIHTRVLGLPDRAAKSGIIILAAARNLKIDHAHFAQQTTKHGVEHFVTTKGPPVHAHARQSGFNRMQEMGRSYSPWAAPLHKVPRHVGITDASMTLLFLIATRYPILPT